MIPEQESSTRQEKKQQASVETKKEEQIKELPKEQTKAVSEEQIQPISQKFVEANIEISQNSKKEGNQYFKNLNYIQAIGKYQQSLRHTPKTEIKFRCIVYSNMAICFSRLQNYKDSIKYCKKALQYDSNYEKAQLNLATNYEKNDNLEQALQEYKKILAKYPKDMKYALKVSQLQKKVEQKNQKMKKQAIDGLKSIGNSLLGYFGLSLDNFKMQQGANGGYSVAFKK